MPVVIPFNRDMNFTAGRVDRVSPLVRRVMAPNPSAFTFLGTNTYIVGHGRVAVIDPGPAIEAHKDALVAALAGETVTHILVTHTHLDHSPLAMPLKAATGGIIAGYGPHGAGKAEEGIVVEEGGDMAFVPELVLRDGATASGPGWTLEALHTPGHCSNHLCFILREENGAFTGDHVMSWSTSVVVPPDGDMVDYMASLARLKARAPAVLWPAHGGPVAAPDPFLAAFIAHRKEREAQILDDLAAGPSKIPPLVARIYKDVSPQLHPAAARSVHAHLIGLVAEGRVAADGAADASATYTRLR